MNHHPLRTLAAASLVLLSGAPAFAQQPAKPAPAVPAATAPAPEKRFDIQLDGGLPAEDVIAQLSEKLKEPINVIFTGDSASTQLPALRLHQVTLAEFFAAVQAAGQLETSTGGRGYEFARVDGAPNIYTFSVHSPQPPPNAPHSLNRGLPPGIPAPPAPPAPPLQEKISLFFDLSEILNDQLTIEDITTAIRTAWTAAEDGKEPPPEALKFHQETKLLIATGFPSRLTTVTNIVKLLQDRNRPSADQQVRELERMARQRQEAEAQSSRMAQKLDQTEKEKDQQIRELRDRVAELEIELAKRQKVN